MRSPGCHDHEADDHEALDQDAELQDALDHDAVFQLGALRTAAVQPAESKVPFATKQKRDVGVWRGLDARGLESVELSDTEGTTRVRLCCGHQQRALDLIGRPAGMEREHCAAAPATSGAAKEVPESLM